MAYNDDRFAREARAKLPEPGDDPISHLRHTLAGYTESQDDGMPISCTYNVYGDGVRTGLTWGDLRAILAMIDALPAGTESHPNAGGPRMHTVAMPGAFSTYLTDLMANENEPAEARTAYNNGTIVPRGPHFTRLITAPAVVLYVFSEYAESLLNLHDDASEAEIRAARKWLKDMSDRGI